MTNKLFCPYELSLLAKDKGFNEPCFGFYYTKDKELYLDDDDDEHGKAWEDILKAPLYSQITDWLREEHKLHIGVDSMGLGYVGYHNNTHDPETWNKDKRWNTEPMKTYNEALTKALESALNLIPDKK